MSTQFEPVAQEQITHIESGRIVTTHPTAAAELADGLLADTAFVAPKYLYDLSLIHI